MQETSTRAAHTRTPRERNAATAGRNSGPAQMGIALEAARVAATLFVAFYHAGLAYLAAPMRLTLWLVYDPAHSPIYDGFVYWVNGWVMPIFFLAAGVSAPRGLRVPRRPRFPDLPRPAAAQALALRRPDDPAADLHALGIRADRLRSVRPVQHRRLAVQPGSHRAPLRTRAFLVPGIPLLVCVVWCVGWMVSTSLKRRLPAGQAPAASEGWVQRLCASPWKPVLFAVPTALIFCFDSDTMIRVNNALVPNPLRLLHYTYFFAVGAWISKIKDPKERLIPGSTAYLALAMAVYGRSAPCSCVMPPRRWTAGSGTRLRSGRRSSPG